VSLWRQLARGVRRLTRPALADRDIDDEVQDYLDRAAAEHAARGLSPEESRRAARLELGSVASVSQQLREFGWEHAVRTFAGDVQHAARGLAAAPGFTTVTVFTLALGIGATTAIFSALKPVLIEPLPYPDAHRIAMIWETDRAGIRADGSFGMYLGLAARARSFESLAVFKPWQPTLAAPAGPERLEGQRISAAYFDVLGVSPILGRTFHASEDTAGGPNVVVLSDALWRVRFGADAGILGTSILLDGAPYVVVGVMPPRFENVLFPSAALWAPMQYGLSQGRAWGHHLNTVGRLRTAVEPAAARRELNVLAQRVLDEQHPETYADRVEFIVTTLRDDVTREVKPTLLMGLVAVALVLTIACVNVVNLLLARAVHRRGEFALRAALGAGRRRLIRQVLTETLVLAAVGGAAGMWLAVFGVRALVAMSPPGLPRAGNIAIDTGVLVFAAAVTTAVGVIIGAVPAWQAARNQPGSALVQATGRSTRGHRRTRRVLVVAEVSLALVLLVCSGLLWRSLERLLAVRLGFDSRDLLTLQVQTSGPRFRDSETTRRFYAAVLEAVRNVPGVTEAAYTSQLPLSGDSDLFGVHFDPPVPDDPGEVRGTFRYSVAPGYIETMRIPLLRGRLLDERDREGAPHVALISETMAKRRLHGRDPIGLRVRIGPPDSPLFTVVGVVADVKQVSLASAEADAVYTTEAQWHWADPAVSVIVRARDNPGSLAPAVRSAIWSVDRTQAVVRVATMDDLLADIIALRRFALVVVQAFALTALLLAAAGLYGVLAGSVAERTREIGIRSALGASPGSILGLIVREGLQLASAGTTIGLLVALVASRWLTAMLFGVSRGDLATHAAVVGLMLLVATAACWIPGRRAVRLDPVRTLRME
jgi:putative ABC transport system permease protein